ncbi:hypothetical protein BKA93DRAFT_735456 [Sparassis latifolia]|uniref:Asparagine--tRNA ligase, mitochondrial n=1 Tax=Sparassis crispa TaxID=139825 RepID=A0A401GUC4_9APHY|nr:Asparagine--tRNA ligase, mitochondrial [Sparassis crispa]GBE85334.1 Asparagine--tRNA ligase, mitochondrial [Sparassis crispa]
MIFRRFLSTSLPPTIRQLLSSHVSAPVEVTGWVKSVRRQKNIAFAVISDGSSDRGLQAVFTNTDLAKSLTNGASVRLGGKLSDSPGARQDKELQVDSVEVLGDCDPSTYPIQKKILTVDYLRDHCHLRARTDTIASMLRLRDHAQRVLHHFYETQGFCYVHTPILTSSDCEGAGETFGIAASSHPEHASAQRSDFFGLPAYLTVSSQLHLEAIATAISRVYTLSPCFRAERSQTGRHLAEFWMLEAEWAFTRSVDDICRFVEASLKDLLQNSRDAMAPLWNDHDHPGAAVLQAAASSTEWVRISYSDAVTELEAHQRATRAFAFDPGWGKPLQSEHERWLAETLVRGPVFVTDYPAILKPFYMRMNDDGKTVACFDLLIPHMGELAGGSLREERHEVLKEALNQHNLPEDEYGWYLDLRMYGGAPHGGFGMGFERLISWMSGIENVRECIAMPRWSGRMLL